MVEGKQRDEWLHTCEVMAMIANTVRDPKKRKKPYLGKDLYPFARDGATDGKPPTTDISTVINMFNIKPGGARPRGDGVERATRGG